VETLEYEAIGFGGSNNPVMIIEPLTLPVFCQHAPSKHHFGPARHYFRAKAHKNKE
jgi:hypothetical protein